MEKKTLLGYFFGFWFCGFVQCLSIDVPECEPPDFPEWGGYGPRQDFYVAGDVIHYFCDVDTYIGGNFMRRCEDTGGWSGHTPVCDSPAAFASSNQTSIGNPPGESGPEKATDGIRSTCMATATGQPNAEWYGILANPGELIRVMVFLPRFVDAAYEVILVKRNGEEMSCGETRRHIQTLEWQFHNCPGPNNRDAVGVRIKSLSAEPLKICEIVAHVLVSPTCVDPSLRIMNGRMQLTRKTATLVCDRGFTRSRDSKLECIRDGVWNVKQLYCMEKQWEGNNKETSDFDP